jgi:hypothetical protein
MVGGGPDLNLATDRGAITVRKATAEDLQSPVTAHSQQGDAGDAETEPKAPKTPKTPPPQSAPHTVVL